METYTTTDQQLDLIKLINEQRNEPIILKNNSGNSFLIMPFSTENIQDILMLYKSFNELSSIKPNNLIKLEQEPKMTTTEFTKKWLGFMKDTEISENYKEEYYKFLNKKYQ